MEEKVKQAWDNFLDPTKLRASLIVFSLFITALEMLKDSITERPKELFFNGFDKGKWIVDEEKYKSEVLSLNRSPVYASLEWFKKMGAIDENDIFIFTELKEFRNEIAHKMHRLITEGAQKDPIPLFKNLSELLNKLEKWWIREIEIPTNPDFDGQEVNDEAIEPGKSIAINMLLNIALGSEEESTLYYKEYLKLLKNAK